MKKLLSFCALAGLLSSSSLLEAAILTEASQSKPSENVIFSINGHPSLLDGRRWRLGPTSSDTTNSEEQKGQSFLATQEMDLSEVVFRVATSPTLSQTAIVGLNAPGAVVELKIYLFDNKTSFTPLQEVYSNSGTLPDAIVKGDYLHFKLDQIVKLEAGKQYGIVLFFKDPELNQYMNLMNGASYADGIGLRYVDGTWADGGVDFEMHLVTIPEPSKAALTFLGGAAAGLFMLRSRRSEKASY